MVYPRFSEYAGTITVGRTKRKTIRKELFAVYIFAACTVICYPKADYVPTSVHPKAFYSSYTTALCLEL